MLAALILHVGETVTVDDLTEFLWAQRPPSGARGAVQAYVMRLRQVIRDDADNPLIRTASGGYVLAAPPESVDLVRFNRVVQQADEAAARGDTQTASRLLGEALGLWRGPPLADIDSDTLSRYEVPKLGEQRLLAIERRAEAEFACGRHREVLTDLCGLVAEHPMRERYWYLYMLALSRSGRRAEALSAYRRARKLITEELGIEPGDELRQLHQAVLTGRSEHRLEAHRADREPRARVGGGEHQALPLPADPAAGDEPPAGRRSWVKPCQLPRDIGDFVGREELADQIRAGLTPCGNGVPIRVISGVPGIGKTALALRVAHRVRRAFPDGQLYARLTQDGGTPRDPAAVLADLMVATGLGRGMIPDGLDQRATAFRAWLADRRVLVVLDDATTSAQVRPLLPGTGGCAVLVTSRADLRGLTALDGARQHLLGALSPQEAVTLLGRLAGPARVAEDPAATAEIAALCGHLPLALRIAAANLTGTPARPLRSHLLELEADRLGRLAVAEDPAAAVRTAFDMHYASLDPALQRLFHLLGTMPAGDITVAGVAGRLGADHATTAQLLDHLADANLIHEHVRGQFRMHDLLRVYAAQSTPVPLPGAQPLEPAQFVRQVIEPE